MKIHRFDHIPAEFVECRHLWGQAKREELNATEESEPSTLYDHISPNLDLGLPFAPMAVNLEWSYWPSLPDLFPTSFTGAKTNRDGFLVDIDLDLLKARVSDYFNTDLSHDEIARRYPIIMNTVRHFDASGPPPLH